MTDMELLERAYTLESDPRKGVEWRRLGWSHHRMGVTRKDVDRLLGEGLLEPVNEAGIYKSYRLSDKGRGIVLVDGNPKPRVPAAAVLAAMDLIIGFDDLKQAIAGAVESQRRIHFMLEGPPACAKSLILEGVRQAVPEAFIAFGSRTSAAGLSEMLFEKHPCILLLDEADKMRWDVYSVLLGLMEHGEVIETKSKKSRGIKLETTVLAACNSSAKMTPEFLSRFSMHAKFPAYTRDQFIDVCRAFLSRVEGCPPDLAALIGTQVYGLGIGDVRKARGVWQLMNIPTEEEMHRVVALMMKYGDNGRRPKRAQMPNLL